MGFKCSHCGSNRSKKVNGRTVCADCGHDKAGVNRANPNLNENLPPIMASPTPQTQKSYTPHTETWSSGSSGRTTSQAVGSAIRIVVVIVFLGVLIWVFNFVIPNKLGKVSSDKFVFIETPNTSGIELDHTRSPVGYWIGLHGVIKNTYKDLTDVEIILIYTDSEGEKTFKKDISPWKKGDTKLISDKYYVVSDDRDDNIISFEIYVESEKIFIIKGDGEELFRAPLR